MNVYQKLAEARYKLKAAGLKQSGKNRGVGYTYFDLQDILPQTTKIENELGLLSVVSFAETQATLTVHNTENPEETIVFTSPLRDAELRGCHPVQNLGAVETYVRRYLYLLAYEIVETETLDKVQGTDKLTQTISTKDKENKQEPTKVDKMLELIKGTKIDPREVTKWIAANFGSRKPVSDLTDEEFEMVYAAFKTIKENSK